MGVSRRRKGKREYLNDSQTRFLIKQLDKYFISKVEIPLIRHGSRQMIETLINEEALLLAKFLRDEKKSWIPRIAFLKSKTMRGVRRNNIIIK